MSDCKHSRTQTYSVCMDCFDLRKPRLYTRAEMLAFGERVRRECGRAVVAIGPAPLRGTFDNAIDDAIDAVDAVDVARLLEETT